MHSIVQFPENDDHGNPIEPKLDALQKVPPPEPPTESPPEPPTESPPEPPTESPPKDNIFIWGKKKILGWFHFSKLGNGHSETLGLIVNPNVLTMHLPPDTKYEAAWWDRTVSLDGYFHGPAFDKDLALQCATEYANRVSIGNLTLLRQFLEGSMKKTDRPHAYVDRFMRMLTTEGGNAFYSKLKRLIGADNSFSRDYYRLVGQNVDLIVKVMLGFTRKRHLLVPAWADDTKLWVPQMKIT